jgi:hypothetical protein
MPDSVLDLDALPPAQRAAVQAERERHAARIADLEARNRRLEHLVHEFQQALYGKSSERLDADARQLAFEDLEVAVAAAEAPVPETDTAALAPKSRGAKRNLGRLPQELPREEHILAPESTAYPCGCGDMVRIGEDRTERLDIVPARFRVIATIRPRYACPRCQEGVHQAPAPAHLI